MNRTDLDIPFTFDNREVSDKMQLELYRQMLLSRMIEEKMLVLLRQGKISKWFSGIGQEAIAVGVTHALQSDEYILPMHRNLGVFTSRGIPLHRLFSQWQGKANGFTKGRDRSFHFGTQEYKIIGMISHLGPQMGVADGIALAHKLKEEKKVTAVFTGEGGTSEGDFHEALNLAAVWDLPVLFCVENNGYGLSTPTSEQFRCEHIADRGAGYGMESYIIDGNNILEVYTKVSELAASLREKPRPVLLEFKTFRIRGHEEASGTAYVPDELIASWQEKDPVINFEKFLLEEAILSEELKTSLADQHRALIDENLQMAFAEKKIESTTDKELEDVYFPSEVKPVAPGKTEKELRFVDAVSEGLRQAMERFPELVLMGQDVAEYGGVFKVSQGFTELFGKERIRNTPICESAVVSCAMGLSINGMKAVMEMQFSDFVTSGFNPIVNYLAKTHYRWGEKADVVIRMPCGAGVGAGPFHSQTNEAWFTKVPGLKVVYPAFPFDAKGLLIAAIEEPNPVLYFEHKALYRSLRQMVPESYYNLPLGKAAVLSEGRDLAIITYGAGVHWALEATEHYKDTDITLVDLRSLQPLDTETIFKVVRDTGKVLVLHEDTLFGGLGGEISALISENCFEYLDAPVKRVGSLDTPVPFSRSLEENFLANHRLYDAIDDLLRY
ncbi:alpha-ketoacid dehydrogenase subunit alpha/beta [Robertkochia aurantiaca]|uniref:alpha-ketoacid dehydrogenase subunit alpha/beta n=1 Tax=Robertkochia aurantiaca TaxID=2873700 RepID=UPI001CCBD306|nr:dehydrogenase E1 component subunit alpha/beta [Robertkochia sp. 3YJGBD-33]